MVASIATAAPKAQKQPTSPTLHNRWRLVLFPARAFLALGWIRAAAEKIIDPAWWTGDYLLDFLAGQQATMLDFVTPLSGLVGETSSVILSLVVLAVELVIGICLLTTKRLRPALWTASLLNVAFIALGAVSPSAFYLVIQMTLLLEIAARQPNRTRQGLTAIGLSWFAAALMLPFVRTLHPHEVIEDPAIMLATMAALTATTLTVLRVEHSPG